MTYNIPLSIKKGDILKAILPTFTDKVVKEVSVANGDIIIQYGVSMHELSWGIDTISKVLENYVIINK